VVQQVIAVLRDPNADARRIGQALSRDPVLSAKVLRLANSSFFAGQRSVASIEIRHAADDLRAVGRSPCQCCASSNASSARA